MKDEQWELEFGETGIAIKNAHGVIARVEYPVTEAGVLPAASSRRRAQLIVAAPALFDALNTLLAVIDKSPTSKSELDAAKQVAKAVIERAQGGKDSRDHP